jgi:hypothetical protein
MTRTLSILTVLLALGAGVAACGSSQPQQHARRHTGNQPQQHGAVDDHARCDIHAPNIEISEYDTSGDSTPDVRRVFRRVGDPPEQRLVLTCREADLNGDGIKDVVRFYNDEGRPLREEADRNFDGQIDTITYFQDGRIIRIENDDDHDGQVDSKTFYDDDGHPLRTERDIAHRSTPTNWHPDRWEYYENGHMVRMGTDLDGDGRVDRWDRDRDLAPAPGDTSTGASTASSGDAAAPSGAAPSGAPPSTGTSG